MSGCVLLFFLKNKKTSEDHCGTNSSASVQLFYPTILINPDTQVKKKKICFIQDPAINITELKEIHSEINLTVPEPILLPNLHDGLQSVRFQFGQ